MSPSSNSRNGKSHGVRGTRVNFVNKKTCNESFFPDTDDRETRLVERNK